MVHYKKRNRKRQIKNWFKRERNNNDIRKFVSNLPNQNVKTEFENHLFNGSTSSYLFSLTSSIIYPII